MLAPTGGFPRALAAFPRFGAPGAPARMQRWLGPLLQDLAFGIKVTGSNGKGSTSHLAAHALAAHGLRVGLFTSPHFLDFEERIQVVSSDGRTGIARADLEAALDHAIALAAGGSASQFEILTLAAAQYFVERRVDAVVWEAGIGGRCDATRVFPVPVSVLTQVALEHANLLGDTLEAIASDKAQIATPGSTLILGPLADEVSRAARMSTEATRVLSFDPSPPPTGLLGDHQRRNAGCAAAAVRALLGATCSQSSLARGFAETRVPGRFEHFSVAGIDVWVDAAHDPTGLAAARETILAIAGGRAVVLLLGISADRPIAAMVGAIASVARSVIVTQARHRGLEPYELARHLPDDSVTVAAEVGSALALAVAAAQATGGVVLATGGLFLAAELAAACRGRELEVGSWG